ncbi:calcium-dependent protein kinase 3-like [Acetobacter orientalis]|uniref:Calcium-dependent protein kinase 3-like n=1 Tax=Acetobacter orientalis TaxID=146474 RepID=A0A2Z5ZH11_9PROT|nr:calcium-dependent protein kinase 3-like [Acetobacter orientalis]
MPTTHQTLTNRATLPAQHALPAATPSCGRLKLVKTEVFSRPDFGP